MKKVQPGLAQFVYSEGLKVRPKGEPAKRRYWGKYRAVVINTNTPDENTNQSAYQVRCDVLLVRSQVPLANVPVMSPAGVNDARPWAPTPTTGTFSGEPLVLRTFSKRGKFEGDPTSIGDMNGDHVLIEFIEGDPDFPMIVGKLTHEFTNRAMVDGDGWSNDTQDAQRGTPEKREAYLRHWGTEIRVNATGDVLVDTVGATQDIENEVPDPEGGEVRVRLKRGQELVAAGGSIAGEGELGGKDLLGVKQDVDETVTVRMCDDEFTATKTLAGAIEITLSDQLSISISELGAVTIEIGGITYDAPVAGPATVDMLSGIASFVRGEDLVAAINAFFAALNIYTAALAVGTPANPVLKSEASAAATTLATAITAVSSALQAALSQTIKGE